jgi:hypothetical protein
VDEALAQRGLRAATPDEDGQGSGQRVEKRGLIAAALVRLEEQGTLGALSALVGTG